MAELLTRNQTFASPTAALAHYGKKGMRWGVRNDKPSSGDGSSSSSSATTAEIALPNRSRRVKQVAIGLGILTAVAGAGYVGYQIQKNGGLKSFDKETTDKGEAFAQKVLKEPTVPIHGSRGKNLGFRFVSEGGLDDPFHEWERAGFNGVTGTPFTRYGDNNEKIALTLKDPDGRTDAAGRRIVHDIVVPSTMSTGINSEADVVSKIWPKLKPAYDEFYEKSLEKRY